MSNEDAGLREANKATIRHVFGSLRELGDGPESGLEQFFAKEVLFEAPYRQIRLLGIDQIHRALREVADQFTVLRHLDVVFTDGTSPDDFVWESRAEGNFRATGEDYPQTYVGFCTMKDGKIMTLRQYASTAVFHRTNDAAPAFV